MWIVSRGTIGSARAPLGGLHNQSQSVRRPRWRMRRAQIRLSQSGRFGGASCRPSFHRHLIHKTDLLVRARRRRPSSHSIKNLANQVLGVHLIFVLGERCCLLDGLGKFFTYNGVRRRPCRGSVMSGRPLPNGWEISSKKWLEGLEPANKRL
jgi:hypothetical protein